MAGFDTRWADIALAIAVIFLWPWGATIERRLELIGLSRRVRVVSGGGILVSAAVANLVLGGQLDGHLMYRGDFQTYYVGAQVGLRHGWSHLFDEGLQRPLWTAAFADHAPFIPYLNTPPQAWLVAPLALLPFPAAFAIWVGLMTAAALFTARLLSPAHGPRQAVVVLVGLSLWVLAYSLAGGQNAIVGALAIALCWWLVAAGRPGWAGVALALIAVRPNAAFLVPVALLFAGQRRLFATWLLTSLVVGAVVLASLGPPGVRQFLELGAEIRRTHPGAVTLTVSHVLGGGLPAIATGLALAALALAVAWRAGRPQPEVAIAAGVLASLFLTPYIHIQDYLTLIAGAGMVARSTSRASYGLVLFALLLAAPPGALFGDLWPAVLLAVEVVSLGWLMTGATTLAPTPWPFWRLA
ncbi:MAG TPA: glycosyltransferase family 87 protein [Candidatus Dormibacteraeota bacterium]|nr:glycosyltransferase family 87 protein [Candidatus Dormibacteraeota bacterium]